MNPKLPFTALLLLAFLSLTSSCVMLGYNTVHSPQAEYGFYSRYNHWHGGVTKKSPPDGITLAYDTTLMMHVRATPLNTKAKWVGPMLAPVFPAVWLRKRDYYKDMPGTLVINLHFSADEEISFEPYEVAIVVEGDTLKPFEVWLDKDILRKQAIQFQPNTHDELISNLYITSHLRNLQRFTLRYQVDAHQVGSFVFSEITVGFGENTAEFVPINFTRQRQRWTQMGPAH